MEQQHPGTIVAALIAVALVGVTMYFRTQTYDDPLYYLGFGSMLVLAGGFGLVFRSRTGLRLTLVLVVVAVIAATLALPELDRQLADGAFWIGCGWLLTLLFALVAWSVGGFVRAVSHAIATTRQ